MISKHTVPLLKMVQLNFCNLLLNAILQTTKYLILRKSYMKLYCLGVNH